MSSYAERTHSKASTNVLEIYKLLFQKRPPGMTDEYNTGLTPMYIGYLPLVRV